MKRSDLTVLTVLTVLTLSCSGDAPSNAGILQLTYFQGGPEAGALLITVTGGPVDSVSAVGGQKVSFATPTAGVTRMVIAGTLANGDVLKLHVPDVTQVTQYHAHVDQVADKTTFALLNAASYTLTVHK